MKLKYSLSLNTGSGRLFKEENAQTSVEVILLIGAVLVLTIISGTYIYRINSGINDQFNKTMTKARDFMLGSI